MSVLGGHATPSRRICVRGDGVAQTAVALAEAQGHQLLAQGGAQGECHLVIQEAAHPEDVSAANVPVIVMVRRRLRSFEARAFEQAGADRVIDANATVLELAFAFSDLLFASLCEQRRYARKQGGARVRFRAREDRSETHHGRLVGIARAGTYLITEEILDEDTPIEMELELAGHPVRLLGRVACQVGHDDRRGFGVEFSLGQGDVAPRLCDLSTRLAMPLEDSGSVDSHITT